MLRLGLAILASSFSVVPLYLVALVLTGDLEHPLLLLDLLYAFVIALTGVVLVGLPAHLLLARAKKQQAYMYGLPGLSVPALFVLIVRPFGEDGLLWIAFQAFAIGLFGLNVALIFLEHCRFSKRICITIDVTDGQACKNSPM